MPHIYFACFATRSVSKISSSEPDVEQRKMRVVLQNNSTSLYLGNANQWTPGFRDAHDFQSLENLVEFSRRGKLEDVQVVIIMEKSQGIQFFPFPIQRLLGATSPVSVAAA